MLKETIRFVFLFAITFLSVSTVLAATSSDNVWQETDEASLQQRLAERTIIPASYKTFSLNKANLLSLLSKAPLEFTSAAQNSEIILTLPMPNGTFGRFRIERSPVVEAGLVAKYPELGETFRGQGIDDPTATVRFDILPSGFHSMILSANGTVLVDPYFKKDDTENYISYLKKDAPLTGRFICDFREEKSLDELLSADNLTSDLFPDFSNDVISGTQLRTYRLALAATNEYATAVGGNTIAGTLAAQVLIMNRVNGVYERDLAIHMNIVANNDLIIYAGDNNSCGGVACTNANDPYTNNNGGTMLTENTTNLNTVIQTANYDIGHVFSTGGGGVANLNGPCGTNKARGVTGLSNPVGDAFAIDYVAHEMGHQWGANHTFNANGTGTSNCNGNRSGASAYEPGSGITIMAYAGICGAQDLDRHSIDTFHVKSLEVIVAYSQTGNGNTCASTTATGNTPPTVTSVGGTSFNIPKQTPFALTASGTDVNNDSLTYDWQEYDLGAATTAVPNTDSGGAMPIFRPYVQTVGGTRTFPALQYILNNANVPPPTFDCGRATPCLTGELLPAITRTMNFQAVARDNRANGGGINTVTATVLVDGNSGPFTVTSPNTNVSVPGGVLQTITWNIANTTAAPVNATNVKISLSTDGGNTFPNILRGATANDGTEAVSIPLVNTTTARIKIEAVGNIFFDISDVNFTITNQPTFTQNKRFDFDGDGKSDISVYRNGIWYVQRTTAGFFAAQFGIATDKTVAADYDGDGKTDIAVFRDGVWYIINSGNNSISIVNWGLAGDIPVQGDYDGDGKADIGIYRNGVWYIVNSANGSFRIESFGLSTDKPVLGNFDGDTKQDLAVYRNGIWYVQASTQGFFAYQFGLAGDIPQPADFDGDGKTDFAVYRNGIWYVQRTMLGFAALQFGIATDIPATADYDGDGKADFVVFRPSEGNWYLFQSQSGVAVYNFGLNGDKPIPAQSN